MAGAERGAEPAASGQGTGPLLCAGPNDPYASESFQSRVCRRDPQPSGTPVSMVRSPEVPVDGHRHCRHSPNSRRGHRMQKVLPDRRSRTPRGWIFESAGVGPVARTHAQPDAPNGVGCPGRPLSLRGAHGSCPWPGNAGAGSLTPRDTRWGLDGPMPLLITPVSRGRCRPSPDRVSQGAPSDRHVGGAARQVVAEPSGCAEGVAVGVQAPGGQVVGIGVDPHQSALADRGQRHGLHHRGCPGGGDAASCSAEVPPTRPHPRPFSSP
jgi:hypothetical protein